jgi:predicted AAA+ superfamily ATPase
MVKRHFENLDEYLQPNKVLIIYGPRRVGKTTLLKNFLSKTSLKYKLDSGDNITVQNILSSQKFSSIMDYAHGYELIAIDEAQLIPNIGMGLKILVDQIEGIKIIATGSSSFDIAQQVGEPLTGRKRTLRLFPVSQSELLSINNKFELKEKIDSFLIFGSYPEIVTKTNKNEKIELLTELVNSYLLKDILSFENLKSSKTIQNLLTLLSFQIGNPVSFNELATQLSINVRTVARYIDLLEKSFILFRLSAYSRNLRNEIKAKNKYYFYDTGIRNALITQFNDLNLRNDIGQLWENFLMIERLKKKEYNNLYGNNYFWKSYNGNEIDLVEEKDGRIYGFEFKWNKIQAKIPKEFLTKYPNSEFSTINQLNYLDFIL